jgi:hypothetical protein
MFHYINDRNTKEKKSLLIIFFIGVAILGIYEFFERKYLIKHVVCTKATVISSEGYKGGLMITIRYKYLDKQYESKLVADLGKSSIGHQYFIQFYSHSPDKVVFLKDKSVPDCLLNIDPPILGWKEIPTCP